jgi:hypothetical protein
VNDSFLFACPGYAFGVNEGLSLRGARAFEVYSIDIRFYFDDIYASINTYQKIIDVKNRTSGELLIRT